MVVDGTRIAYCDRGQGHPVVFVHGTPSHSFIWRDVLPEVIRAGHRVVAYDLLGYGASERPIARDTSVTAQAVLLEQFLTHLGIRRATVVGHDIGGAIALIFATQRPERLTRLVLIDTVSYDSWPSPTWQRIIADHLDEYAAMPLDEFEALLARQLQMTVADPQHMQGVVLEAYLAPHRGPLGRASFFEHQVRHYDSAPTQALVPALRRLTVPAHVLWGAEDRWQPLDYAHRLVADIPEAELVVIDHAGHFVMEDTPARVAAEVCRVQALPFPSAGSAGGGK